MRVVAALTDRRGASAFLSPFFAMAPWVLIGAPPAVPERLWLRNRTHDPRRLCGLLAAHRVQVVLCGWIDAPSAERLMRGGISIALGPCDRPVAALVTGMARRVATPFPIFETLSPDAP